MIEVATSAPEAGDRWGRPKYNPERIAFGKIFHALVTAWYGSYYKAGIALGVHPGSMLAYCSGRDPIPDRVLLLLLDRRSRDLGKRVAEVEARVERVRKKADERLRIIRAADEIGVAAFRARLAPKTTGLSGRIWVIATSGRSSCIPSGSRRSMMAGRQLIAQWPIPVRARWHPSCARGAPTPGTSLCATTSSAVSGGALP